MNIQSSTRTLWPTIPGGIHSLIVLAVLLLGGGLIQAQTNYSIAWSRIAGGGGTCTNGQYILRGTLGQHDAGGPLTGGKFTLTGGFWAPFAVQTPGAPLLRIFLTSSNTAVVAWPAPSTGWTLQHCSNLATPGWSAAGGTVNVTGNENQVIIHSPTGNRFFRLAHPNPVNAGSQ